MVSNYYTIHYAVHLIDSAFLSGLKSIFLALLNVTNSSTLASACTANNKKFIPKLPDDNTALFNSVIVKDDKQYDPKASNSSYLNLDMCNRLMYVINEGLCAYKQTGSVAPCCLIWKYPSRPIKTGQFT